MGGFAPFCGLFGVPARGQAALLHFLPLTVLGADLSFCKVRDDLTQQLEVAPGLSLSYDVHILCPFMFLHL